MADTGTSDTAAAVGGGGAAEANTNVEGGSTSPTVTNGTENLAILGAPTAQITAENQTADGTGNPDTSTSMPSSLLPAALIGSILDFVPYKDLRTALLTGKLMANVVSKQVNTINIMRSSELVPAAVRRFPNVTEVNCLCLVTEAARNRARLELSVATTMHIVPFLSALPKLKAAFVGGRHPRATFRDEYNLDRNGISPTGHEVIFRALIEQFCTSFQSGDLPGDLDLRGILPISIAECEWTIPQKLRCRDRQGLRAQCKLCRKICAFFPFRSVVRVNEGDDEYGQHGLCVPTIDRIRMLKSRPNSLALFQTDAAIDGLLRVLDDRKEYVSVMRNSEDPGDTDFIRRMQIKGCAYFFTKDFDDSVGVAFLRGENQREIRELVSAGFDVTLSAARRDDLMKDNRFSNPCPWELLPYPEEDRFIPAAGKEIWDRSSFDFLLSIGFDLDPTDFILLDLHNEPAVLRRMKEEGISVLGVPWSGIEEESNGSAENTDVFGAIPGGFAALSLADADANDVD